jgi:hypothetical protein
MIIVKLKGGLGNQMFQYAFGYALAKRKKTDLAFDINWFNGHDKFTDRKYELDQFCISKINSNNKYPQFFFRYSILGRHILPINKCFEGYFQSESYFSDCKEDILMEFEFNEKLQLTQNENTVSVHVRRGDYVKLPRLLICTPSYYEKAVSYIQENIEKPVFYIFSEDVEWVRQNISFPDNSVFMDYDPNLPSSHDMQLMGLCKHNIISNSSYSWWAAWLNRNPEKIILAPDKWDSENSRTDLYTDNMIKIAT